MSQRSIFILMLALLGICAPLFAQLPSAAPGKTLPFPFEELGLNREQRAAIAKVYETYEPKLRAAAGAMESASRSLDDLVAGGIVEEESVRAAANLVGMKIGDLALLRAKLNAEARAYLSDFQQRALVDKFAGSPPQANHPGPAIE
jgi:Spy/CpxP family protein refolding chaperone